MALDNETLGQLLRTVEKFVNERLRPLESDVGTEDRIPDEIIQEMRDLGLFGLTIPEEYGGLGLNMSEEVAIARVIGYVVNEIAANITSYVVNHIAAKVIGYAVNEIATNVIGYIVNDIATNVIGYIVNDILTELI